MQKSELLSAIPGIDHGFLIKTTATEIVRSWERKTSLAKQVHGHDLIWSADFEQKLRVADAIATSTPNHPIGVQTADCTPILLAAIDEQEQPIGVLAIHAGWRGAAQRIVEKSVHEFLLSLAKTQKVATVKATIGPCISKNKFEVGEDVTEQFPHVRAEFKGTTNGQRKYWFDLEKENYRQLCAACESLNFPLEVDRLNCCTFSNPDQYPSFRRDGGTGERIIAFISLCK